MNDYLKQRNFLKRKRRNNFTFNIIVCFILFFVLIISNCDAIRINNCSSNGEYYVDLDIYDNLTGLNDWSSFSFVNSRSVDNDNTSSSYFSSFTTTTFLPLSSTTTFSSALTTTPNYHYVVNRNGNLYQLNHSFTILNTFTLGSNFIMGQAYGITSQPLVIDDYLYVGASTYVYQFNASNISNYINRYYVYSSVTSSPMYKDGYIYIGSQNGYLYQLNASNISRQISNVSLSSPIYSTPTSEDNYVYASSGNSELFKLNSSNVSQIILMINFSQLNYYSPAIYKGVLYFPSENDMLIINTTNFNFITNISNLTGNTYVKSPFLSNDNLYFSNDKTLYHYNISNVNEINLTSYFSSVSGFSADYRHVGLPIVMNGYLFSSYSYIGGFPVNFVIKFDSKNISNFLSFAQTGAGFRQGLIGENILTNNYFSISSPTLYNNTIYVSSFEQTRVTAPTDFRGRLYSLSAHDPVFYHLQQCPNITFINFTEINNSIINRTYLQINTSTQNGTFDLSQIKIYIYNITTLENTFTTLIKQFFLNYTPITNTTYYFNASATDIKNNTVWTETRKVTNIFLYIPPVNATCYDGLLNQDEVDVDYGGTCGQCVNRTSIYDDASYLLLKESGQLTFPFDESQCDEGDATLGFYLIILFVLIFIFVILGVVFIIFGIIPFIIFIFSGRIWLPFLRRKKKENDDK